MNNLEELIIDIWIYTQTCIYIYIYIDLYISIRIYICVYVHAHFYDLEELAVRVDHPFELR